MIQKFPNIEINDVEVRTGKYGTGIFANRVLEAGTDVIVVPRKSQVTLEAAIEYFEANHEMGSAQQLDGVDTLSLYIAVARKKGLKEFQPYINALPETFTTLLENWPESTVAYMTSELREKYETNREEARSRFDRVKSVYGGSISRAEFNQAYWAVFSRMKEEPCPSEVIWPEWLDLTENEGKCAALAPVFDMANHHNTEFNCDWNHENGATITTLNRIAEGEELLINYGHEANSELISLYGFALDNNASPIAFSTQDLNDACAVILGLDERVCSARIDYFETYFEVDGLIIDANCDIEMTDTKEYLIGHYDQNDQIEKASADLRWSIFTKFLISRRLTSLQKLQEGLENDNLHKNDTFGQLLNGVYQSERTILNKCKTVYDEKMISSQKSLFGSD